MALTPRHIQDFSQAAELEPHWGYADRVVPCTNDPGSCAYLDVVYESHDKGMVYTGIFWLTIGGILLVWAIGRRLFPPREPIDDLLHQIANQQQQQKTEPESQRPAPSPASSGSGGTISRLFRACSSTSRRYLLPALSTTTTTSSSSGTSPRTPLLSRLAGLTFGRSTTRLQVVILAFLSAYLLLFSFIGIVYDKWVTPAHDSSGDGRSLYNTRTSLGPWADRVGVLAYALTPLSVLLASRENLLSLLTGAPYTSFIFLHRWTGYIIVVQSLLHTLGWVLVEAWLYQPQPEVWNEWVAQDYAIWGFVGLGLLVLLWIGSMRVVVTRVIGYEAFRKAHYVLAMVYIGALIGHWKQLQCFLVPGLALWGLDRGARLVRMGLLHYGYLSEEGGRWGFRAAQARVKMWKDEGFGDVVRLDFDHAQKPWAVGQHFFLCFTDGSIWQSHPFTPLSLPVPDAQGRVRHSYIFRAKQGETKKVAGLLWKKLAAATGSDAAVTTPVVMQGPYGQNMVEGLTQDVNVLCVAGGTGITYVLPVLIQLVRGRASPGRKVELVWACKRKQDLEWVEPELEELRRLGVAHGLVIRTFITAEPLSQTSAGVKVAEDKEEKGPNESSDDIDSDSTEKMPSATTGHDRRPDVNAVVTDFLSGVAQGPTRVFGSGPPGMIGDLRTAVARCNSGSKVWRGEERFDVRLACDDRLED